MSSEDSAHLRRVRESVQLESCEGPKEGEEITMGTRMVGGSFLNDIPPTSAFNALHQPYQLYECRNDP